MKTNPKITQVLLLAFLFYLTAFGSRSLTVLAQSASTWSPQQRIPGYSNDTNPPILIADQNRTVHAFASQQVGENGKEIAVIYSQWTLDQGWTDPVDILLSPTKNEARLLSAFLDKSGMFHVIFFGGDNTQANIYYSKAPAINAGQVSAWSPPALVGEGALNPENGVISGDDKGNLVIVFSGIRDGNGLYALYSNDGGNTWSNPESLFLTNDDQLFPFDSRIYSSQSGQLYIVWSLYNQAGDGLSVYFSRFDMNQGKWSDPVQLASGVGLGVGLPDVIEYQDNVVVTYYNSGANAQWMIQSNDQGQTWTEPARISQEHIGRNGAVSLAIDSNNVLHLWFGGRIPGSGGPDIHGMWHTTWQNRQFSPVEAVVSGPQVHDLQGDKGFDPYDARAIIVQGNELLVTWRTDPGAGKNSVWHSFNTSNSFKLPAEPLPTPKLTPTIEPTQILSDKFATLPPSQQFTTPSQTVNFNKSQPDNNTLLNNQGSTMVIALIPVAMLISSVIIAFYLHHHYRT